MQKTFYPHLQPPTRTLAPGQIKLYLDRVLPSIYAELYSLPMDQKYQVLTALRTELMYWGSRTNYEIAERLNEVSHATLQESLVSVNGGEAEGCGAGDLALQDPHEDADRSP